MNVRKLHTTAAITAGLSLLAGTLAGCSAAAEPEAAPESITVWGAQSTPDSVKSMIEVCSEEIGTEIELEIIPDSFEQNVLTKWTTGQRPDAMFYQPNETILSQLNPAETMFDLGDLPWADAIEPSLRDAGSVDGVNYTASFGAPVYQGIFYNIAAFEDNNISLPTNPAEFTEALDELKDAGVTPFGLTGGDSWTLQMPLFVSWTHDNEALQESLDSGAPDFTAPEWIDAIEEYKGLVDGGYTNPDFQTLTYDQGAKDLAAGKFAMTAQGSWMVSAFGEDVANVGFIPWPSESGAVGFNTSNIGSIQVPKTGDAAREDLAKKFVECATTGPGYATYLEAAQEPSIYPDVPSPEGIPAVMLEAMAAASASPMQTLNGLQGDLATLSSQLLAGTISPDEMAAQLASAFEQYQAIQGE